MDKATALTICPDFRPVRQEDGRLRCRFYCDDSICKRPEYFRCELTLHREKEERLALAHPPMSVSRIGTVMRCPRLYAFNYVWRTEPPIPAKWKVVGRAFSDAIAKIDNGLQYELTGEINSMPLDRARLRAILKLYQEWRRTDWGPTMSEVRVFFPYKDMHFLGFIDKLTRNRETIIEWKYAATQYDEIKALRQACVYFKGIPEAKRFILAVAKKPQQKLLKAKKPTKKEPDPKPETPFELEKRIYEEFKKKDPDEVFKYNYYDREFFDIDATIEQIYQTATLVQAFEKADYPPVLGMNCDNCDYRPYCLKHLTEVGCSHKFCSHPTICDTIRKVREGERKELPAQTASSK